MISHAEHGAMTQLAAASMRHGHISVTLYQQLHTARITCSIAHTHAVMVQQHEMRCDTLYCYSSSARYDTMMAVDVDASVLCRAAVRSCGVLCLMSCAVCGVDQIRRTGTWQTA